MTSRFLLLAALAVLAPKAHPQQQPSQTTTQDKQGKQQPAPAPAPAPLFGGQIGTRSSQSTKESATLGFNGIDPSGKVEKKMLGANPGPKDAEQVRNLDSLHPTRAELVAFLKQGGLKSK
jgi:hypothetical protein